MTDTADIVPSDATPENTALGVLRHEPGSVADALDVHMRLTALSAWVNDRKGHVTGWLKAKGEARLVEDGAAPTWRLTDGLVLLTDPKPAPAIEDRDAFAAWYEAAGGTVGRRRTATVDPDALLGFYDKLTGFGRVNVGTQAAAAEALADAVTVTEDVLLPADVLDGLLASDDLADPDVGPRIEVHDSGEDIYLVDVVTGERVPGTTVRPAGARTVQVRPDTKAKARVRAELDRLLGPPQLGG